LLLTALAGILVLGFVTRPWGMGLSADSSGYIASARSLLKGEGFREIPRWNGTAPMINFPPLESILLGLVGLFGIDPLKGAQVLNLVFFGANIFLTGVLVFHLTRSLWMSLAGSFFVLTSLVTLEVHAMVWSEPPFLFFGFLGLFFLALYLEGRAGYPTFLAAGASMAFAFLAKYSGVSFVLAALAGILLLEKKSWPQRLVNSFVMGGVSCFPMVMWLVRNRLLAGRPTELSWYFEPYLNLTLRKLLAYPSTWLLPESVPAVIRGGVLMLFLVIWARAIFVAPSTNGGRSFLSSLCLLLIASHVILYLFTTVFMGEQPFDNRALSPVFIAAVLSVFEAGRALWKARPASFVIRMGLPVFLLALSLSYAVRAIQWGSQVRDEGLGYASREWRNSPVIEGIKKLPSNTPIYTNGLDAVYLLASKPVSSIPAKEDVLKYHVPDSKHRAMKNYPAELERMKNDLQTTDGVVVYLNKIYWRWYYPTEKELEEHVSLQVFEQFNDGTIYRVRK